MNTLTSNPSLSEFAVESPAFRVHAGSEQTAESLLPLTTTVIWLLCFGIGIFGFVLPYARPHVVKAQPPTVEVELLNVNLSNVAEVTPANSGSDSVPAAMALPQAPQPVSVAEPSPSIAFTIPVKAFSRVTNVRRASYARSENENVAVAATPVQRITFGQGAGRQPAPEYPFRARREGQQGTVVVRLTVGENGSVLAAEAVSPCPWQLLNDSAVRTVKTRWQFAAGKMRVYEVPIRFELTM